MQHHSNPTDISSMRPGTGASDEAPATAIRSTRPVPQDRLDPSTPPADPEMPAHLFDPPGFLGEVAALFSRCARRQQPAFAVQTAIACAAVLLARLYETKYRHSTVLYLLNVGESGAGKENIRRTIEEVLHACGDPQLHIGGFRHPSALLKVLCERPRSLSVVDDFSGELAASRSLSPTYGLAETCRRMRRLFQDTTRVQTADWLGFRVPKTLPAQCRIVHKPSLSICASVLPDYFHQETRHEMTRSFLGQFLVCHSTGTLGTISRPDTSPVQTAIPDWYATICARHAASLPRDMAEQTNTGLGTGASELPPWHEHWCQPVVIPFEPAAESAIRSREGRLLAFRKTLRERGVADLLAHHQEIAFRLSLIVALSRDPDTRQITATDAAWAGDYVLWCGQQTATAVLRARERQRRTQRTPRDRGRAVSA